MDNKEIKNTFSGKKHEQKYQKGTIKKYKKNT